jgi:hypothetical protein
VAAAIMLVVSARFSATAGQDLGARDPSVVEAAYIRNFARYVTWPAGALPAPGAPWRVGVLGRDSFVEVLERTLRGRTEQGRPFEIHRAASLWELPVCQIIFVGQADPGERRLTLRALHGKPVLTVGDAPEFLREGGVIEFVVGNTVQMGINLDQARAGSLQIQTKMLEVSREVLESGIVKVMR